MRLEKRHLADLRPMRLERRHLAGLEHMRLGRRHLADVEHMRLEKRVVGGKGPPIELCKQLNDNAQGLVIVFRLRNLLIAKPTITSNLRKDIFFLFTLVMH